MGYNFLFGASTWQDRDATWNYFRMMAFTGDGFNLGQYYGSLKSAGGELDPSGPVRQAQAMQVQLLGLWYERVLRIKNETTLRNVFSKFPSCIVGDGLSFAWVVTEL